MLLLLLLLLLLLFCNWLLCSSASSYMNKNRNELKVFVIMTYRCSVHYNIYSLIINMKFVLNVNLLKPILLHVGYLTDPFVNSSIVETGNENVNSSEIPQHVYESRILWCHSEDWCWYGLLVRSPVRPSVLWWRIIPKALEPLTGVTFSTCHWYEIPFLFSIFLRMVLDHVLYDGYTNTWNPVALPELLLS